MEVKLFELRDDGTFIPLLCIKPQGVGQHEIPHPFIEKMAWRYGYRGARSVIVLHMGVPERGCHSDPYAWGDRTFRAAHHHVESLWDELKTGDLIDVRVVLGETTEPCKSEA